MDWNVVLIHAHMAFHSCALLVLYRLPSVALSVVVLLTPSILSNFNSFHHSVETCHHTYFELLGRLSGTRIGGSDVKAYPFACHRPSDTDEVVTASLYCRIMYSLPMLCAQICEPHTGHDTVHQG